MLKQLCVDNGLTWILHELELDGFHVVAEYLQKSLSIETVYYMDLDIDFHKYWLGV